MPKDRKGKKDEGENWKRIEPTTVTEVGWRSITSKTFVMPNGEVDVFDTVYNDGQEFASVIALTSDREVIIAREFCVGPEKVMNDLPGGYVDSGEKPEEAAKRELLEETGYVPGQIHYLGTYHKDAYLNATWHGFIAFDCVKQADQKLEREEDVEVKMMSIEQFLHNAKHNGMTDHAVVLMAYDQLKSIEKESI